MVVFSDGFMKGTLKLASSYQKKKAKPMFSRMKNRIASLAVKVEESIQKLANTLTEIKILEKGEEIITDRK